MMASGKNLDQLIAQKDKLNTGLISVVEFKNVIQSMKLGIKSTDIDILI